MKNKAERHQISTKITLAMIIFTALLICLPTISADISLNPFAYKKIVTPAISPEQVDAREFMKAEATNYPIIQISKTFFWIATDKVAEYKITYNTDLCLINCKMRGKAVLYQNDVLFEDAQFTDLKTEKETQLSSYNYYIRGEDEAYDIDVLDYGKEECKLVEGTKNNTQECTTPIIGSHKETRYREIWNKYNKEELRTGEYEWELRGVKDLTASVDAIPLAMGKTFEEWAVWNSSKNAGLRAYYDFSSGDSKVNNATNGLLPSVGSPTLISNATSFPLGDGKSAYFDGNDIYSPVSPSGDIVFNFSINTETTLNFWYRSEVDLGYMLGKGANTGAVGYDILARVNPEESLFFRSNSVSATTTLIRLPKQKWYMGTITRNLTDICWYSNGTLNNCKGSTIDAGLNSRNVTFGATYDTSYNYYTGWLDEMGWWNRTLSTGEINDLYNSGTGLLWVADVTDTMTGVNSYPLNNSNISTSSITFGCNFTGGGNNNISSIILYVNNSINWTQTQNSLNAISVNQTFTNSTLADGTFTWTCTGFGSAGVNGSTALWTVNKDTTAPVISTVYPANQSYNINVSEFNWTVADAHTESCWFTNDSGTTNYSIAGCTTPFTTSSNQGSNTWIIYANDSAGNTGSDSVTFFKDTIYPNLTIVSPANQTYTSNSILINITSQDTNLQSTWFYNGTGNTTYTDPITKTFADGTYTLIAYANDTVGNINTTSVTFSIDGTLPNINISYPSGAITPATSTFGLNYSITDAHLFNNAVDTGEREMEITATPNAKRGIRFTPKVSVSNADFAIRLAADGNMLKCYLENYDSSATLATETITGGICTITYNFIAGTIYGIRFDADGEGYDFYINNTATYPYLSANVNFTAGINTVGGDDATNWYILDNITLNGAGDCWYEYNGANITAPCSDNSSFTYVNGINNLRLWAKDTFGNMNYNDTSWIMAAQINNATYNATTSETALEGFTLNATIDSGYYSAPTGTITYKGTTTNSTTSHSGNYWLFKNSVNILAGAGDNGFYWTITLNSSDSITSMNYTQTVGAIESLEAGVGCSAGYTASWCANFSDEYNFTVLTMDTVHYDLRYGIYSTTKVLNGTINGTDGICFCINETGAYNYKIGYGEIAYHLTGFQDRKFYIYNNSAFNNATSGHILYAIETTQATPFQFTVTDTNLIPYKSYYLSSLRWHPEIDGYIISEMVLLDDKGQGTLQLEQISPSYRYSLNDNSGNLIYMFTPRQMVCTTAPCTYSLYAISSSTDYDSYYGVETNISYNNNTGILTFVWNDPSTKTTSMNFTVTKEGGAAQIVICSEASPGYTGALTCNISGYTGAIYAKAFRSASPSKLVAEWFGDLRAGLITSTANGRTMMLFMGFILTALIALTGIFAPVLAMVLAVLALIPLVIFGGINLAIFIGFGILAFVVYHAIKRSG